MCDGQTGDTQTHLMPNHRVLLKVFEHRRQDRASLDELELAEDVRKLVLEQG